MRWPQVRCNGTKNANRLGLCSKMGIVYSDHVAGDDGAKIFAAACELGLEGIVSKRRDRPYVSGLCKHWIKVKNPNAPWKKRLAEG